MTTIKSQQFLCSFRYLYSENVRELAIAQLGQKHILCILHFDVREEKYWEEGMLIT
ncbi:MAG: hypothetical protein QNJ72_45740 [Pleurocapsa sp. MO_226.B13]|nr:hypothetical protein [Pleurocapsa sp. MO_226.B13]